MKYHCIALFRCYEKLKYALPCIHITPPTPHHITLQGILIAEESQRQVTVITDVKYLYLETAGSSATTSLLKLATLRLNFWFLFSPLVIVSMQ